MSAAVRFRILGTLEFATADAADFSTGSGDGWSAIGAAKQRALLAALLLSPNQVVPVDRLVAELWHNRPPASVNGLLAGYVWRLRRVLRDRASTVLVTRPPGYLLALPDGALDVHEYEALAAGGRAALAAGNVAAAANRFGEALACWRGAPFADVAPSPAVMAEAARLEESRLAVTESLMGAEIALGRHEALLPELKQLVSQHPLRERLHAHLMLTLYRAGQQADALGAYHDLRRLLVNELGIEPSKPLRELQQQILREDPALLAPPLLATATVREPQPAAGVGVVPRGLPADSELFVGRQREVAAIGDRLRAGGVCGVYGAAGAGTSATALRAAHEVAGAFPDGQLWLDVRGGAADGPVRPAEVVGALLAAFGLPAPTRPEKAAEAWTAAVAGRRVLVVLDDVAGADQVRPLLNPPPGSAVLLAGRPPVAAVGPHRLVRVGALPVAAAVDLLRRCLEPGRVDAERAAAAEVARLCGYLPLALRLAGGWLARRPELAIADWARRLADPRRRLDLLAGEDRAVRASLGTSLRLAARDDAAHALVHLLGALDMPVVAAGTVGVLLDRPEPEASMVAERLVDLGLVETLGGDRYRVPDLVRLFAREQRPAGLDTGAAVRRVIDHHVALVREQLAKLAGAPSAGPALAWYRQEIEGLRTLADREPTDQLHKAVDELRWALPARRESA